MERDILNKQDFEQLRIMIDNGNSLLDTVNEKIIELDKNRRLYLIKKTIRIKWKYIFPIGIDIGYKYN